MEGANKVDLLETVVQQHSKDIEGLKQEQARMQSDINHLQTVYQIHDHALNELKNDLKEIKDDTKWLRRTITHAVIVATITGLVALVGGGVLWFVSQNLQ